MGYVLVFSVPGDNQIFLSHLQRFQGGIKKLSCSPLSFSTEGHYKLWLQIPAGSLRTGVSEAAASLWSLWGRMMGRQPVTVVRQHIHLHVITSTLCANHSISQYFASNWKAKDININKVQLTEKHYGEPVLSGPPITIVWSTHYHTWFGLLKAMIHSVITSQSHHCILSRNKIFLVLSIIWLETKWF